MPAIGFSPESTTPFAYIPGETPGTLTKPAQKTSKYLLIKHLQKLLAN